MIFNAFDKTPFDKVKVVIIWQDPYHWEWEAHWLCFSVQDGVTIPPSLRNIYKEMNSDLWLTPPKSGNLTKWTQQWVFLLNATLTVRKDTPNSHKDIGWQIFTDAVIKTLSEKKEHLVFILRWAFAQQKKSLIDETKHFVICSAHPSPFSADRGFFGCLKTIQFFAQKIFLVIILIVYVMWDLFMEEDKKQKESIKIEWSSIMDNITVISENKIKETFQSNFSIKEDINTPESMEKIRKAFSFYKTEVLPLILSNQNVTQQKEWYHGLYTHTQNVVFHWICYAVSLWEDPIPVVLACACHDLARKNDNRDTEHWKNAVSITTDIINNEKFNLTGEQKRQIVDAVSNHTTWKQALNYISACLWDADRTRLSWERGYRESFFNTEQWKIIASWKREDFVKFQNQCVDLEWKNPDAITPEEFNLMLMNRDDIKYLDEHLKQYKTFSSLSPEMVSLYDKIIGLPRIQEMSEEDRKSFLERLFSNISKHCDVKSCLDIIPSLINEWCSLDIIKRLSIREDNVDLIRSCLDNEEIIGILKDREEDEEDFCRKMGDISKFINVDNFKCLEDCINFNIDEYYLSYFNEDTKDIIWKYLLWWCNGFSHMWEVLDRLHRRWHNLQSVEEIFWDESITPLTSRLLEFKDFNKFKDVWIKEYIDLPT